MERLTIRENIEEVSVFGDDGIYYTRDLPHIRDAINRLAAYEDTWLTPEEIKSLLAEWKVNLKCLDSYRNAEADGRLIVLPVKIGDKIRDKIADYIFTVEKIETCVMYDKQALLFRCGNPDTEDYMAFYDFEIGENIEILSSEEAEAALAKEKENNA